MTETALPEDTLPAGSPAEAFETMGRRLAGLRSSIDGFAARQEELHGRDYSDELATIKERCEEMRQAILTLDRRPAMALTPKAIAEQIERAGSDVRLADHAALDRTQYDLRQAIGSIGTVVGSARSAEQQNWWLAGAAAVAIIVGFAFGAVIPARIDQAVPESWHWPEERAAAILGRDGWSAGERMLQVSDPAQWRALSDAARLVRDNASVLAQCAKRAKAGRDVNCTVKVAVPTS